MPHVWDMINVSLEEITLHKVTYALREILFIQKNHLLPINVQHKPYILSTT